MSKRKEEINGVQITSIVFNSVIIVSLENEFWKSSLRLIASFLKDRHFFR